MKDYGDRKIQLTSNGDIHRQPHGGSSIWVELGRVGRI